MLWKYCICVCANFDVDILRIPPYVVYLTNICCLDFDNGSRCRQIFDNFIVHALTCLSNFVSGTEPWLRFHCQQGSSWLTDADSAYSVSACVRSFFMNNKGCVFMPWPLDSVDEGITFSDFCLLRSSVWSSGQILLPWYLTNGSSNIDETFREYSLSFTDDLIRLWRSKVKVIVGRRGGEGIHVDASWSPIF